LLCQMASLEVSPETTRVDIAVNMAAPKSIIVQVLEAISVIPFAGTEIAQAHPRTSFAVIFEGALFIIATLGWSFDRGT